MLQVRNASTLRTHRASLAWERHGARCGAYAKQLSGKPAPGQPATPEPFCPPWAPTRTRRRPRLLPTHAQGPGTWLQRKHSHSAENSEADDGKGVLRYRESARCPQHAVLTLTCGLSVQSSRVPVPKTRGSICAPATRSRPGLDPIRPHQSPNTALLRHCLSFFSPPGAQPAQDPPSPELGTKTSTTQGGGGGGSSHCGRRHGHTPSHSSSRPEAS